MSAVLAPRPIKHRVLRRPAYVITPHAMANLTNFVSANLVAISDWYEQLREIDPDDFCDLAEFCAVQYERELVLVDKLKSDMESRR